MKLGKFCLLPQEIKQENNTLNYIKHLILHITTTQWRFGKTILFACKNKLQTQKIDQLLWKFNKHTFLPHHLCTSSTYNTSMIIYWPQCRYNNEKKYFN